MLLLSVVVAVEIGRIFTYHWALLPSKKEILLAIESYERDGNIVPMVDPQIGDTILIAMEHSHPHFGTPKTWKVTPETRGRTAIREASDPHPSRFVYWTRDAKGVYTIDEVTQMMPIWRRQDSR